MSKNAPPDPNSAAWLVQQLADGRVLDAVQVAPYLSEFRAAHPAGGRDALADFLVHAGLLTAYQAERAKAGEANRLPLGPYLLAEPLGSGGMGTVYRAVNRNDRKQYAVKVLPLRSLWNVKQAKRQVQAVAGLAHPAVVPFVDVDTANGFHFLAWTFAAGTTLAKATVPLAVPEAIRVLAAIADGLAACHGKGIVHGLVKPSNVLIGADGQPRLLDLGVGSILTDNMADSESMLDTISTANAAMGMLDCCAPETANEPSLRTPAGDVYSFGCTAFFALTGRLPFTDGNAVEKIVSHQMKPPPAAQELNPETPDWLNDLIRQMMAKAPADRPDMTAVRTALGQSAAALPPPTPAATTPAAEPEPFAMPLSRLAAPKPKTASMVDFELPAVTQVPAENFHAAGLPAKPRRTVEPTDPLMNLSGADLPLLDPWGPKAVPAAPPPRESAGADLPTPVTYSNAADADGPRRRVTIPPPPSFARGLGWFLRGMMFWSDPVDVVQISVFGPPSVSPGESFTLQVFAHQPAALESVATLARAVHQTGEMLVTGFADRPVARGGDLGLHMTVSNAGVAKSLAQLNWRGQPQPRGFEVHVPWESHAGVSRARLSVGVEGVLSGQLDFDIQVNPRQG